MWTAEHRERYKDDGRRYPSDLTQTEWETIAPFITDYRTLTVDMREVVNACLYLQKTGCGWRYLPTDFGPWETVRTWHDRFKAGRGMGRHRSAANPGCAPGAWPQSGAFHDDPRLTKREVGTTGGRARGGWQEDGEGHQAPRPHLLLGFRTGGGGHRG